MDAMTELFGEPISTYSRAQAIEDGMLVAVPEALAREAGFKVPVAITQAAWASNVAWNDEVDGAGRPVVQDEAGRLWDVLWMSMWAAKRSTGGDRVTVEMVAVPPAPSKARSPRKANLVMVIGPGDTAEPVITIMLPNED